MAVELMSHLASLKSQPERALRLGAAYEAHLEKIGCDRPVVFSEATGRDLLAANARSPWSGVRAVSWEQDD